MNGLNAEEAALELDESGNPVETEDEEQEAAAAAAATEEEDDEPAAAPAPSPAPAPAPAADAPAPAPAPVEAPAPAPSEPPAPQYTVEAVDFKAAREALDAREAELDAKFDDGLITREERQAALKEIRSEDRELTRQEAEASTITRINQENAVRDAQATIAHFKAEGAKVGIDYTNPTIGRLFDAEMQSVASEEAFAGKTFRELATEAHARIAKIMAKPAAATPAPAPAPAPRPAPDLSKLPPTLHKAPPALDPNVAGNEFAHLDGLEGAEYEKAIAKLTPEQLDRFLA